MELQNTVKEALNALYHHPDDAVRMQADRWLQDFQRTIDAWQVADNLLHDASSNQETLIFCSQTLRSKVQRDFEELPSEAFRPLRDSLNTLLKTFHKGPQKVRTQISLAVAALAVHVPADDWGDGGIINWLRDEMNSHPEFIPSFLELLRVLPEEVFNYKIAARPDRRHQFEKELASAIETALNILTACLNINELKEQVLEAFASWLRLRHRVPASALSSHPLVLAALSSLSSEILSEASVNVISELIHYTAARNSGGVSSQLPLIQVIVPQVMNLKPQLRDPSKDEEDIKAIARLFADLGDAYVELIATGSDESMLIVHALLEVASHPEFDIASMTFNFWHNLQMILTERESYTSSGNETSIEAEKTRRLQVFSSSYESLVSLVTFRVQYPQDFSDLSTEDQKDFKQTRYAVADVLIDGALVLGGEPTLKILYMKLVEAINHCGKDQHSDWRPAEAALYCIRAISDYVSDTEAEVMPQIMSLLPKLPHQPQLLQTVCLTIGAYSRWLNAASSGLSFLPSLIDILVSGMSMCEDSAAAAALAFRHICNDCKKKLCGSLDGLFQIYQTAVIREGPFKVSAEDSLHLVEALSMVITELPSEQAKKALEAVCLPSVAPLQEMINQGPLVLGQKTARELTVHFDRLANIFRYVNHPEAVADAIQRLWPIFKAIFDVRAWDMRTMESLCRACKNAVRTSKRLMGVTIGAMLEEIQGLYGQHYQPCFLYLSSEVIKIFGSDADVVNGTSTMNSGKPPAGSPSMHTVAHYSFFPGRPRWPASKTDLTYAFLPQNGLTDNIKSVFSRAFERWSEVTPLTFSETASFQSADIKIGFFAGDHNDGEPFDGPMGTLAHAFSPPGGHFHLDGDENWVINGVPIDEGNFFSILSAVDLESVAVHEIGHLLGLGHSSVEDSIMYPSLAAGTRRVELANDDIQGVQVLYGSNPNFTGPNTVLTPTQENDTNGAPIFGSLWVHVVVAFFLSSFVHLI